MPVRSFPQADEVHEGEYSAARSFLCISQTDVLLQQTDSSTIHIHKFSTPVVRVMIRYFYYQTLDMSGCPESAHPSVFAIHMYIIACKYEVEPLRELALAHFRSTSDPQEDVEDFVAALAEAWDYRFLNLGEMWMHDGIRNVLHQKAIANIHELMSHESFRMLMESRRDLEFQLLKLLAPKTPAAVATGGDVTQAWIEQEKERKRPSHRG
jgi:hypothetical protein